MGLMKYELYEHGELVGKYTARELVRIIGVSVSTVYDYASAGRIIRGKYQIRPAALKDARRGRHLRRILDGWDEIRARLLQSGYNLGRIKIVREMEGDANG